MKKKFDAALPLRHFVGICFGVVIFLTCLQVICRYVFNHSLVWSEELVRFLVVWMCLVGSAVSNYDDDHMTINIIVERFPRPLQFAAYTLRQLLIIVFCVASSISSIPLLKAAGATNLGALPLPGYTWRGAATVGLMIMAVMTVFRWIKDFNLFRKGEFCLKDADTLTAEEVADTVIEETGVKGADIK